uniref:Integrase catalytic domain-containing protein n=1 Tax=Amphimedon queenslandica TaxID=400682 RepID=A0A1X7UW15_AMPQE
MRQSILQMYYGGVKYSGHCASNAGGGLGCTQASGRVCPDCAVVSGGGRKQIPPLQPIPVQRPFQILGVDIMEQPTTKSGNQYDQKAIRIARLLPEEILPMFGVPKYLLSDMTNLLANVMKDVCELLWIEKTNTTAYHPQCNGMVEQFKRTLKAILRKHAAKCGPQWDLYLPGVLWAYRITRHEATKEKPTFLMFGVDLRSPTEVALVPMETVTGCDVVDCKDELILSLSSARDLAVRSINTVNNENKKRYDQKVVVKELKVGDWVLVRFAHEESGKQRKLSKPWSGPYRIIQMTKSDIVVPIDFPESGYIQVHSSRESPCPSEWPVGSTGVKGID